MREILICDVFKAWRLLENIPKKQTTAVSWWISRNVAKMQKIIKETLDFLSPSQEIKDFYAGTLTELSEENKKELDSYQEKEQEVMNKAADMTFYSILPQALPGWVDENEAVFTVNDLMFMAEVGLIKE